MGLAERQYDSDNDESFGGNQDAQSSIAPKFGAIEGGGESSEPSRGHLSSVPNESSNGGSGAASANELSGSEQAGDAGRPETGGGSSDKTGAAAQSVEGLAGAEALGSGGLYNPAAASPAGIIVKGIGWLATKSGKRKAAGGAVTGLLVGGAIFSLFAASGPLEIIHLAELLNGFHMSTNNNEGNDRTFKELRALRNFKNGVEYRSNMVALGNKFADRAEAKLNAAGYESSYNPKTGQWEGLVPDRNGPQYKNMSDEQFKTAVKENLGVELKQNKPGKGGVRPLTGYKDGTFYIDPRDTGYSKGVRASRGVVKDIMIKSGYSNISSTFDSRVMGRRFKLSYHPIKRLDARLIAAADRTLQAQQAKKATAQETAKAVEAAQKAAWLDEQAELISKGETAQFEISRQVKDDPNATPEQKAAALESASAQAQAEATAKEATAVGEQPGSKQPGAISKFTESVHFKVIGGAAGLVALACLAKGVDENATSVKESIVIEPLMRNAGILQSTAAQIKSGIDNDLKQNGYLYGTFVDPIAKTSIIAAQSIQGMLGNGYDSSKVSSTLLTIADNASPFHALNQPPIGPVLNGACGTIPSLALTAVGFLGGPVSASIGIVIGAIFVPKIEKQAAEWFSGKAINIGVKGADKGDQYNYGYLLNGNAAAIGHGANKLTQKQTAELRSDEVTGKNNEIADESFIKRTFDPTSTTSITGNLVDSFASIRASGMSGIARSIFSGHVFTSTFGSIFTSHVSAAKAQKPYDFGLPKYAFSREEMDNESTSDPFQNANKAADALDGTNGQTYVDRAKKCYGAIITQETNPDNGKQLWNVMVDKTDKQNYYSAEYNSAASGECSDSSNDWLRVRFMIFDTQTMKAIACDLGDSQSCVDLGFDATSAGVGQ